MCARGPYKTHNGTQRHNDAVVLLLYGITYTAQLWARAQRDTTPMYIENYRKTTGNSVIITV